MDKTLKRNFIIGDEWLYLKIYGGYKLLDNILCDCILPLNQKFLNDDIIHKWFFIRYTDPKFHLRVRLHIKSINDLGNVMYAFNHAISKHVSSGEIWKVQVDTYMREIERYGEATIELSEALFFNDSVAIAQIIALEKTQSNDNFRWLMGVKLIDALLDDFSCILSQKIDIMNIVQKSFKNEFGISENLKKQFGLKYRNNKIFIEQILNNKNEKYKDAIKAIENKSLLNKKIIAQISKITQTQNQIFYNDLLTSYIHMTINRLFRTQQRKYELVLYDLLYSYYNSLSKRIQ